MLVLGQASACNVTLHKGFCKSKLEKKRLEDEKGVPEENDAGQAVYQIVRTYSYVTPWHLFEAKQRAFAERADAKIRISRKDPVLQDTLGLRARWLPGAMQGGEVHEGPVAFNETLSS